MNSNISLQRSTPERQGISSLAIEKFLNSLEKSNLEVHSFMLLRHGSVVAEGWWYPYKAEYTHMLFSLSKSFTSTAIGIAINEGLLTLDDAVTDYFPEDLPSVVTKNLASMKIKHLLSMSTGHAEDTTALLFQEPQGNWTRAFLNAVVRYEPGTYFLYNTGATYMLSALLQKITGETLMQYLIPRIFKPLGIDEAFWEMSPQGVCTGGFGLNLTTESIAKFGQLYLQKGRWNGVQLLPEAWVDQATSFKISNGADKSSDWCQGYCYQFWRCRHDSYRGDGAFGQFCIVMPKEDVVIAITSGEANMGAIIELAWNHLLPAIANEALPENEAAFSSLHQKLSTLSIKPPAYKYVRPEKNIPSSSYILEANTYKLISLNVRIEDNKCYFETEDSRGKHSLTCGHEYWLNCETTLMGSTSTVAASYSWLDLNTLVLSVQYITSPFCYTVSLHFNEDDLKIELKVNVDFQSTTMPSITAKKI